MTNPQYADLPGRRMYEQARALKRAKRRPRKPGVVLQFPTNKEEVT